MVFSQDGVVTQSLSQPTLRVLAQANPYHQRSLWSRHLCFFLCVGLLSVSAPLRAQVLIRDTFASSSLDGWIARGTAAAPSGVLALGEPGGSVVHNHMLTTNLALTINVDLRFSAVRQGGPEAMVVFSQTDDNEPFQGTNDAWYVRISHEWGAWSMLIGRRNAWQTTVLATVDMPQGLNLDTWYALQITRDQGTLTAQLDLGAAAPLTISAADGANDPNGAYLALFGSGTGQVDFDNLLVTGADGVTLPAVSFAAATASARENAGTVQIPVSLDQTPTQTATVDVSVSAGSATTADYTTATSRLTFAAGETTQNIALTLIDDTLIEGDESLTLTLSNGNGLDLGTITGLTFTITDNDTPNQCALSFHSLLPLWPAATPPGGIAAVSVLDLIAEMNCGDCDLYQVTVTAGAGGTTDRNGVNPVACNATLTITANADTGFRFRGWSGDVVGTENPLTVDSTAGDLQITAEFEPENGGPTADAGPDQRVTEGDLVQLNGAGSTGNTTLLYAWTQTAGPTVGLNDATSATPTFTAPEVATDTTLSWQLQVTDANQQTATDAVAITVADRAAPTPITCDAAIIGPAAVTPFSVLTTVDIRNDRLTARLCEPAWSSIPVAAAADLTDTAALVLVDAEGNQLAAQFTITSRWGGLIDDPTLPARWLEVRTITSLPAEATITLTIRRYETTPAADPDALVVTQNAGSTVIDTGAARFTLDPTNPALFAQIELATDTTGNLETVYRHTAGAGPYLAFNDGVEDVVLSTADAGRVLVDANGFELVAAGPLAAVVLLRGHFVDPNGRARCASAGGYERFGYTLAATFYRGSGDVVLQYHIRNECSDAFSGPWTDQAVTINEASWLFPLNADAATIHYGGDTALTSGDAGQNGNIRVAQNKGGGSPWQRRAEVLVNGNQVENNDFFSDPMIALSNPTLTASIQMPWLRYREPQALAYRNGALALQFVSEPLIVGEGKGLWNFARLGLAATARATADQSLAAFLENSRTRGRNQLERGLLVRAPLATVNASGIYPSLGTAATSAPKTAYLDTMNLMHDDTVQQGGQWDRGKTYGSQLWPEFAYDRFGIDWDTPYENDGKHAYWNPQGAEMLEFLRSGDPKWVWDLSLPAAWLQMHTAYLNIGAQTHGNRNGFPVNSGGTGEGQWHRSGFGSSDYAYNEGMKLAYALRPNPIMRDRFQQAGRMVVDRFNIPRAQEAQREEFVNRVEISRQMIQYFEMLANCAEYVPGQGGNECHDRLQELLSELALDNLSAGIMCADDIAGTSCLNPQGFMMAGMMYSFFQRSYRNYGNIEGILGPALVQIGDNLVRYTMRAAPGSAININGDWAPMMDCTLNATGTAVIDCRPFQVDNAWMFEPNRPHVAAMVLMSHDLDPSLGMCDAIKAIYDDPDFLLPFWSNYVGNDSGWWKGSAQMMQGMVFGIGVYDTCSDPN